MIGLILAAVLTVDGGTAVGPCKTTQTICFSPQPADAGCDIPLVAMIDSAKVSLDVMIFSITQSSITDAIIRAKKRNVNVRMIVDTDQSNLEAGWAQLQKLHLAGVDIKRDTHAGYMHMKVSIVDDTWFATGSYNYTAGATYTNDENLLIWSCPRNALIYKDQFNQRWNAKTGFGNTDKWWTYMDAGQ